MIDFVKYEDELINLRREFHKHPELSGKEYKTAERIKVYLKNLGIEDIKTCAETGVAAVIYGNGNKTVGIRADIDALEVLEETNLPYKSENDGVMHACGHDGHIAMNLILAKIFMDNKDKLNGNVKLIFQPDEEGCDGAIRTIADGVLENPKVDFCISGHLWPEIDTGKIDVTCGVTFASADIVRIDVLGKGGHGALPHLVNDSLYAASKIAVALKELGIEFNNKNIKNILSICSLDCKSSYNIFNDNAYILGTLRTVNIKEREIIINAIKETAYRILKENGIDGICDVIVNAPALINDKNLTDIARDVIKNTMGDNALIDFGPVMASEDFAYFSKKVPSVHLKIGSGGCKVEYPSLHNSKYEMNEKSLIMGVKAFYNIVMELLN